MIMYNNFTNKHTFTPYRLKNAEILKENVGFITSFMRMFSLYNIMNPTCTITVRIPVTLVPTIEKYTFRIATDLPLKTFYMYL